MPTTIPIESDLEVLEQLYVRFSYLRGQPLRLHTLPDTVSVGTLAYADQLLFVLADTDTNLPYTPDFGFLSCEENASLTDYCQLQPSTPWPQPLLGLSSTQDGTLTTDEILEVEVLFQPSGSVQLWWGGRVGVVFEALVDARARAGCEGPLMNALWDCCERYLLAQGVRYVWTPDRDPEFSDSWYRAFLAARGYQQLAARAKSRGVVGKVLSAAAG